MEILYASEDGSVGTVTDMDNLLDLGEFKLSNLERWISEIKTLYADQIKSNRDIYIQFKKHENTKQPSFLICASIDGEDPKVAVVGTYRVDGKEWGEK